MLFYTAAAAFYIPHQKCTRVPVSPYPHQHLLFSILLTVILLACLLACSLTQLCLTLCDPMDCSMPGFPVLHYLPEFAHSLCPLISHLIPSNHLILCHPLLLLPSIFPSIRVFSHESVLHIRRPKYWSFSFSISPSNEFSGFISFKVDWLFDFLVSKGLSRVFSSTIQKHQFFSTQHSLWSNSHIHPRLLEKP